VRRYEVEGARLCAVSDSMALGQVEVRHSEAAYNLVLARGEWRGWFLDS
jgi:hypothetical protein